MKKIFFLFLFILSAITFNGQAKQDKSGNLIGYAVKSDFAKKQYKGWFDRYYKSYDPDQRIVKQIKRKLKGISVVCFMGTWCGDSKRETPRFYKIMEGASFNFEKNFKLIALNRSKRTPDNLQKGHQIIKVPTFIFYKKGKEIGRYVEFPRETLEEDILQIVSSKPYKHSYQK